MTSLLFQEKLWYLASDLEWHIIVILQNDSQMYTVIKWLCRRMIYESSDRISIMTSSTVWCGWWMTGGADGCHCFTGQLTTDTHVPTSPVGRVMVHSPAVHAGSWVNAQSYDITELLDKSLFCSSSCSSCSYNTMCLRLEHRFYNKLKILETATWHVQHNVNSWSCRNRASCTSV